MTAFKCETCNAEFTASHLLKNHIRLSKTCKASKEPAMTEIKTELKQEQKPKTQTQPAPTAAADASNKPLTPEERALVDQISRQSDDWTQITEDDLLDFSLSEDPLKLPAEAKQRQDRKEMAYRWCERTPKRLAELTGAAAPLKWWVANTVTAPYLHKYIDPTIGGVCRLDQILLLKPWKLHQKVKDAVADGAKALYNSRELDKGGAAKVGSHDSKDNIRPVGGERAAVRGSDAVFEGEVDSGLGELVAAD